MSSLGVERKIKHKIEPKKKTNKNKTQKQKGHDPKNKCTTYIHKTEKEM